MSSAQVAPADADIGSGSGSGTATTYSKSHSAASSSSSSSSAAASTSTSTSTGAASSADPSLAERHGRALDEYCQSLDYPLRLMCSCTHRPSRRTDTDTAAASVAGGDASNRVSLTMTLSRASVSLIKAWIRKLLDTLPWTELSVIERARARDHDKVNKTQNQTETETETDSTEQAMEMQTSTKLDENESGVKNRSDADPDSDSEPDLLDDWFYSLGLLGDELGERIQRDSDRFHRRLMCYLRHEYGVADIGIDEEEDVEAAKGEFDSLALPFIQSLKALIADNDNEHTIPLKDRPIHPIGFSPCIRLTAILEYLCTELLKLSGLPTAKDGRKVIMPCDIINAVGDDANMRKLTVKIGLAKQFGLIDECEEEDKDEAQRIADAAKKNQSSITDDEQIQMFPKTHGMLQRLVDKYAWWQHEDVVKAAKSRFLDGSLLRGDEYYTRGLHVHPVAYLGQTCVGAFVERDEWCFDPHEVESDSDYSDGQERYWSDQALTCVAFDIEDSDGRRWPLLAEYRDELCPDGPAYSNYGGLFHRHTLQQLGRMENTGQDQGTLYLNKSVVAEVFANYALHGFGKDGLSYSGGQTGPDRTLLGESDSDEQVDMEDEDEDADEDEEKKNQSQSQSVSSQAEAESSDVQEPQPKKMKVESEIESSTKTKTEAEANVKYWEISELACAGMTFRFEVERYAAMFSAYHPKHIVQDFTRSMIRVALDSAEVRPLLPSQGMPNELIALIGEYAPVDLPHIRISSEPYDDILAKLEHLSVGSIMSSSSATSSSSPSSSTEDSSSSPFECEGLYMSDADRRAFRRVMGGRLYATFDDDQRGKKYWPHYDTEDEDEEEDEDEDE